MKESRFAGKEYGSFSSLNFCVDEGIMFDYRSSGRRAERAKIVACDAKCDASNLLPKCDAYLSDLIYFAQFPLVTAVLTVEFGV